MKNTTTLIQASIISLFATHFATANPVQWKIEDGGNGHWYERTYEPGEITWYQARSIAQARGGDSVVFNTLVERMFINDHFVDGQPYCAPASWAQRYTFWLGLYQDLKAPDYSEPSGGWYWVDGTPLDWDVVCEEPYYCAFSNGGTNPEHFGVMGDGGVGWIQDEAVNADIYCVESALIEWSADCNGDGIVDYGQILDGTYADEDGNGVPDCCDEGVPCDDDPAYVVVPDQFSTVQAGIDAVEVGGTVFVRSGTYVENLNYSKPLSLLAESGAESTILDGNAAGSVIHIAGPDGGDFSIVGFTIRGGVGGNNTAGGIYLRGGADLILTDCVITENELSAGQYGGGGIKLEVATLRATNCRFADNKTSWSGGSIYAWQSCCIEITDCTFEDEGVSDDNFMLDVVHLQSGSTATITGSLFNRNVFNDSEIVAWDGSVVTIRDCRFQNATVGPPTQAPGAGSVISGWASSATTENLFVCGHPAPFISHVSHDDQGGNSLMHDQPCDCNGDGVLDIDQILDGTYADNDGNGVPDCCDAGVPCDGGLSMVGPIQWQVADGGNGHWYQLAYSNEPLDEDDVFVLDRIGAHEATLVSQPELDWAWDNLASLPQAWREDGGSLVGARIGLGNYCLSNFHWVTAEPVTFTSWGPGEPSSNCGQASFFVADASEGPQKFWSMVSSLDFPRYAILLEWDNDCDGNGLIDFGEILDGSATDADGNGIPDHCEAAKKWPSSEGGNGHWYQYITQDLWTYEEGQAHAAAMGAHLASIADAAEDGFVDQRIADVSQAFDHDPFIGADRLAGPWQWLTGEAWAYSDWGNGQPVSWCCDALTIVGRPPAPMLRWSNQETFYPRPIIIEWDADCNGDGIVDIGQILDGIYDDLDGNGVPDCCEGGSPCNQCELADISDDGEVSIEDILILIAFWGPCDACIADLDMSGEVDISDLLIVIDNWGTCE